MSCHRSWTDGILVVWLICYIPASSSGHGSTVSKGWPFLSRAQGFTLRLFCHCTTYGHIMDGCLGCGPGGGRETANVSTWKWRCRILASRRQLHHSQSQRGGVFSGLVSIHVIMKCSCVLTFTQHFVLPSSLFARNTRPTLPELFVRNNALCSAYSTSTNS